MVLDHTLKPYKTLRQSLITSHINNNLFMTQAFPLPDQLNNADNHTRRVGVEFELANLSIPAVADIVQTLFGGEIHSESNYEYVLNDTEFGTFVIELDSRYIKRLGKNVDKDEWDQLGEDLLAFAAKQVVPIEIVAPPIAMTELHRLQELITTLRSSGAEGTGRSLVSAFGLQLNPELPDLETTTIVQYLRAFVLLYDWLVAEHKIDTTRRLAAFVQPYPREYVRLLIDGWYQPTQDELIDDYLQYNADRNRALDMLPLFSLLDSERVTAKVPSNEKIKSRPTFHYRLPNCDIDNPDWSLLNSWNCWMQIEQLAFDQPRMRAMCRAYNVFLDNPIESRLRDWRKQAAEFI